MGAELGPRDAHHDEDIEFYVQIGFWLRSLRHRQELSLAQLSEKSGMSSSFLSQMERGLIQPSLVSLNRVCRALGTTAQAVMSLQTQEASSVVRSTEGHVFEDARVLARGNRKLHPMEFRTAPRDFGDLFQHEAEEMLYVVGGVVEVEVDGTERHLLGPGDTIYYGPFVSHRWRNAGPGEIHVVVVSESLDHRI